MPTRHEASVKNILRVNLEHPGVSPGPHAGLRFLASPLWVAGNDGNVVREASLIPAGFVDYYFDGRLASHDIADAVAHLAAQCVARNAAEPWNISFMTKGAREMYKGSGITSTLVIASLYRPWQFLLSAVIAEAARYLHAGATVEELRQAFGLVQGGAARSETLMNKMAALETWETQQYTSGLFGPS